MKKVITYGTFDLFHEGHYNILKRAKALGDYLIVGVTSESYDIERGKLNVRDSLLKRIENVRRTGFADEIIIEEYQGQKLSDIIKYKVDLLVLGSDWRGKFDYLKNYCDVVYLERTKNISSTKLRGEGTTKAPTQSAADAPPLDGLPSANTNASITGLSGTLTPDGVTFTWDAAGTGTTYLYHVEDPKEEHAVRQTKETSVTVPAVPGRTCLSVAVRNSDGRSSNEAIECVETP